MELIREKISECSPMRTKLEVHFEKEKNRYKKELILDPPVHTQEEINNLIYKIPQRFEKTEVVDFGSGNGRLSIPLLKKGYKVKAVDISTESLRELKNLSRKLGFKIKTYKSIDSVENVDVITGCDILHHIDLKVYSKKLYKTLKSNGVLVFSEPGALNPFWYLYIFLLGVLGREKNILQCNMWNLKRSFEKAGFINVSICGLGLFPRAVFQSKFLCSLNDLLGNLPLIKYFAYRYLISAEK